MLQPIHHTREVVDAINATGAYARGDSVEYKERYEKVSGLDQTQVL